MRTWTASLIALVTLTASLAMDVRAVTPQIDASDHRLALKSDGTVSAWGNDRWGQLGQGRVLSSTTPIAVGGLTNVTTVAAGTQHVLALRSDGTVWAWGDNTYGQLGDGTGIPQASPVKVAGLSGVIAITSSALSSGALKSDGTVWIWGSNDYGILGLAASNIRLKPVQVPGLSGVTAIATSGNHWMALKSDKTVWCWGAADAGQMGNGLTPAKSAPVQADITNVIAIAAGGQHSVALKNDGTVWSWGDAFNGALGDATTHLSFDPIASPTQAVGVTNAIAIATGADSTFAIRADNFVMAWGQNEFGTIGNGTGGPGQYVTGPAQLMAIAQVASIAAGDRHTIVRQTDGTIQGWGSNSSGQIGDGTRTDHLFPFFASGAKGIAVAAGFQSSVAVKPDGTLIAWGDNSYSQLADGVPSDRSTPVAIPGLSGVISVGAGGQHSLAAKQDGTVLAWGYNANGRLGDGTTTDRPTPGPVSGLTNVIAVSAGDDHSMALKADGTVWTWGANFIGQLGTGGTGASQVTPVQVLGLPHIAAIAAGSAHSVALTDDGKVWSWGEGASPSPTQQGNLDHIATIAAGLAFTLALKNDGTVWAWGDNSQGTLCDGTTNGRSIPGQIMGVSNVAAIGARSQTVMLLGDGTILGCGLNLYGELGDTTTTHRLSPVAVANFEGVKKIAAGYFGTFAMRTDGIVFGWGTRSGDGTYVNRASPQVVIAPASNAALDLGNWFLDLDPAANMLIPARYIPGLLVTSQSSSANSNVVLDVTAKFKTSEFGTNMNTYVLGLVPVSFFDQVKSAPSIADKARLEAKAAKAGGFVLAMLTPAGWTDVNGQLIAYAQGVAGAAGSAASILNGVNSTTLSGARFCIGYGTSGQAMLSADTLREVLVIDGVSSTVSGSPCVLSGVYVDGPPTSMQGSAVTFKAAVVGLSPTGSVQFRDGFASLGTFALAAANAAVAKATITTSSLATGTHSIGASYSGDTQNSPKTSPTPVLHVVSAVAVAAGTSTEISGPASSNTGDVVTFTAVVTGAAPTGTVQFLDGAASLGAVPIVDGNATLRVSTLAAGSHSISAAYSGDGSNSASTSSAISHLVAVVVGTQVSLTPSTASPKIGTSVTITAAVTPSAATGNVQFFDGARALATAALAGGQASFTSALLAPGTHYITARYAGDGSNPQATSSALSLEVALAIDPAAANVDTDGDGIPNSAEEALGRNANLRDNDVFGNSTLFAMQQYRDFLAREGDAGGIASWSGNINSGAQSRGQVIESFFGSQEFQGTIAPVARLYFAYFLRIPDYAGLNFWIGYFRAGNSLDAISNAFAGSAEFTNTYGSLDNGQFVNLVYQNVLGRAPDAGGLAFWRGRLDGAFATRGQVMLGFSESDEYRGNSNNEVYVTMAYSGMLRRAPDAGGFSYWVQYMDSGNSGLALLNGFLGSQEYRNRFLP